MGELRLDSPIRNLRHALLAVLTLTLGACGGRGGHDREPFAESQVPPSLAAPYLPPDGWAWGYLNVGDAPVHRYGVASPPVTPRAQIIILPSYGETAEGWFETVRDLNRAGFNVWVLEAAGQGGSERFASPRDLGHAPQLEDDAAAVKAFVNVVVRPGPNDPVVLLASGTAAPIGLRAAEIGGFDLAGLILSDPQRLDEGSTPLPWLRLPTSRAPGQSGWHRPNLEAMPPRQAAAARWTIANPDLRMGGFSWGYQEAWSQLVQATARPGALRGVAAPVLVVGREPQRFTQICTRLRHCRRLTLPADQPYQWAADTARTPWLTEIITMARAWPDQTP